MAEAQCHICGEPASDTCRWCQRPACFEHTMDDGSGVCHQCMLEATIPGDSSESADMPAPIAPAADDPPTEAPAEAAAEESASDRDTFMRRLLGRGGPRKQKGPKAPAVDLHLRGLLNQHQDRVFAYLGRPENVADLSMRGGPLADQEIFNLEYYSKGLRFYRRGDPAILSIHFMHSDFDSYQTYAKEILPGLRVGMTRGEIDAVLGAPRPDDPGTESGKWKSYRTDDLPPAIGNLEVFYAQADDPDAASVIIAIG